MGIRYNAAGQILNIFFPLPQLDPICAEVIKELSNYVLHSDACVSIVIQYSLPDSDSDSDPDPALLVM